MIEKIFPVKLQLNILQLEGYEIRRFLIWVCNNFFKRSLEGKKKLVWTSKARLLYRIVFLLNILVISLLYITYGGYGFIIGFILSTQCYLYLSISVILMRPYEILNKYIVKTRTRKKIESLKKLKVIGVTGSYGKTSIKEFLYHILKSQYKILKTPESYNTLFGISKVVDYELDSNYDFFICEMGAYKIGEIRELCEMLQPTYGVLSGINEQHIERFGSIENTKKAKFELMEAIPANGFSIVNVDNEIVRNSYSGYGEKIIPYGFSDDRFTIRNVVVESSETKFDLILDFKEYKAKVLLIGNSHLSNILSSATIAYLLGVNSKKIIEQIGTLKPVPHRLEVKEYEDLDATIIDDSYNSNPTGFKEALNTLGLFENRPKVLVTPGIVELGVRNDEIHKELGLKAGSICDYIFLIGKKNERTIAFEHGVLDKTKVNYIGHINSIWSEIGKLKLKKPVVLIENDLPDNY